MALKVEDFKIFYTEKEFVSSDEDSKGQVISYTEFKLVINNIPVFIKVKEKTAIGVLKLFGVEILKKEV